MPAASKLELALKGYRLTTADIFYRMPDHPSLLQEFIWQELDLAPRFPILNRYLKFWERNIEGTLHTVIVGVAGIIPPTELKYYGHQFSLH